ncbi:hypothetical protein OPU71_08915 [Niveibacterium sp. 24ML]|uniref:hypothetical protein n=1 Tax=Niveibacterium sp. 24ML TaxID=2985512 RepID=UPI00226E351A|nr:hypothetical protein [Niveibacterium sp. 24ML]MCX9156240.1 hypothetical protein [Niveibacterium sp. 24ML]
MSERASPRGEATSLLAVIEGALGPLHAAIAPDVLRLGDLQVQIEHSLPAGITPQLHWSVTESGRAGLRVTAYLGQVADPRPAVRAILTYVVADPVSGKPSLLDAEREARVAALRG